MGIVLALVIVIVFVFFMLPNIYASRGSSAYRKGDLAKATMLYKKAYDTKRASLVVKLNYAQIVLRDGRPEEAEKIFDEILLDPKLVANKKNMVRQCRCMAYIKQNKAEQAIAEAEELLATYKNSELYAIIGYAMILAERPKEETLKVCEEAYEYNEDNRDIADNYALALINAQEYEEAIEVCDKVIKSNRFFPEGRYHKALALSKLGRLEQMHEELDLLEDCDFGYLTTVTDEEIDALWDLVEEKED